MSLRVGKEEYSDKELVEMYRQQLKAYNDWCVEEARKFFAGKNIAKQYKAVVFYPEVEEPMEISLTDEQIAEYTAFEKEERSIFEAECDYQTEQDWLEWLSNAYFDARFPLDDDGVYELRDLDLHHPINVYRFEVKHFSYDKPEKMTNDVEEIALSDEQYISLVVQCMQEPYFTMAKLMEADPELYKLIVTKCTRRFWNNECAIFLTEAKEDANAILQSAGEDRPHKPEGFFAIIAEQLSRKYEKMEIQ